MRDLFGPEQIVEAIAIGSTSTTIAIDYYWYYVELAVEASSSITTTMTTATTNSTTIMATTGTSTTTPGGIGGTSCFDVHVVVVYAVYLFISYMSGRYKDASSIVSLQPFTHHKIPHAHL